MSEWRTLTLDQLGRIVTGKTPPTSDHSNYGNDVPFITPSDMDGRRYIGSTGKRLSKKGAKLVKNVLLPKDSVLVSCIGSDMGKSCLSKYPSATNQQINSIIVRDGVCPLFVYYNLSQRKDEIRYSAGGSAQPILNKSAFGKLKIQLPKLLDEQQAIASILGALDDKIDCNRRMNETLEAMARAMFKDWFVDFGPTKAKMEGRAPYLAPEIWDLFPDRLDDEGKPEGWSNSEIGKETKVLGGATPSTKEPGYWEGGTHHWATPKDLSGLASPALLTTGRKVTAEGVAKISSGLLPIGTVLLSSRAPVGYLAIAEVETAINQGFIAMVCQQRLSNLFVLFWCHQNMEHIKGISGGSTFAEISKKVFRPIPVTIPTENVLAHFEEVVRPLYQQIVANSKEQRTLAQTRDLLLPKLMSGEIRIRDAERAVEDVL